MPRKSPCNLRVPPIISSIAEINLNHVTSNGTATTWSVNSLNDYTSVGADGVGSDVKGNVQSYNGWSYTYDAQNRLRVAQGAGTTLEFWYDGKNRQITRRINGDNSKITPSVWDGRKPGEPQRDAMHAAGKDAHDLISPRD